jgi:hypothetical protein
MANKKLICLLSITMFLTLSFYINLAHASYISIDPTHGAPGTTISINGGAFGGGKTVQILFDGALLTTVTANSGGGIQAQITVPSPCTSGDHTVTATEVGKASKPQPVPSP